MQLYRNEHSDPKFNAQRNLEGRTHYVDDQTLRYHKARVLSTAVVDNGLLFALIESYAVDYNGTERAYRPVVFDVFGTVLERPSLENGCKTKKQAVKEMWRILNLIDAKKHTLKALGEQRKRADREFKEMRKRVASL